MTDPRPKGRGFFMSDLCTYVGDGFPVPAVEQGDFASVSAHS